MRSMSSLYLAGAIVFITAACGGSDVSTTATAAAAVPTPGTDTSESDAGVAVAAVDSPAAQSTADTNQGSLEANDDVRLIEVLDVVDGSVSSLAEAADGDRPVLVWFWAPH